MGEGPVARVLIGVRQAGTEGARLAADRAERRG
jgi:hypothetical protein